MKKEEKNYELHLNTIIDVWEVPHGLKKKKKADTKMTFELCSQIFDK